MLPVQGEGQRRNLGAAQNRLRVRTRVVHRGASQIPGKLTACDVQRVPKRYLRPGQVSAMSDEAAEAVAVCARRVVCLQRARLPKLAAD